MSDSGTRPRASDQNTPLPYRAAEGLQITSTAKGPGTTRNHFLRSRSGEICQLGEEEYFIFTLLDGRPTFADVQREFRDRFAGELSRRHFQGFVDELITAGIIERIPGEPLPDDVSDIPDASMVSETPAPGARRARRERELVRTYDGPSFQAPFMLLARLATPLRYFAWLLIPAALVAGVVLYGTEARIFAALSDLNWGATDWRHISFHTVPQVLLDIVAAVLIVLLLPRLAAATAAAYHGAPREAFRPRVSGWVLPRFPLDRASIDMMPRKAQSWTYAAPLLTRLALCVIGSAIWASRDATSGSFALFGLLLAEIGLWSFLLSVTPLLAGDGRRWLAAFFGEPGLDRPLWDVRGTHRVFLGLAVILSVAAFAGAALPWFGLGRAAVISELGAVLLSIAFAGALIWLMSARAMTGPLVETSYAPGGMFARGAPGSPFPYGRAGPASREADRMPASLSERMYAGADAWPSDRYLVFSAIALALLICVAFLPYPYDSGGNFTVLPFDHYALDARVAGEVTEVLVHEGEWVNEGQVVGTLSDWNEVHELAEARASLNVAAADLQNLLISPKPEEVEVAKRQYEQSLARLPYSKSDYERKLALVKTNDVSVQQFQSALSTYQQDQAAVEVTKANYDYVRVGPTQAQIAAARATVQKATDQVSFWKDQLGRTRIRATSSGQVVTPDPQLLMGVYLQPGQTFIAIEDHRVAHIEVQVPETDIRDIYLGSMVRAKAWGYEHTTWLGKTVLIAPDAQPNATLGNVVRVVAEIPNPDGLLRPSMSGDAKVRTTDMPVWESFTRAVARFLLIEVWYWIP